MEEQALLGGLLEAGDGGMGRYKGAEERDAQ